MALALRVEHERTVVVLRSKYLRSEKCIILALVAVCSSPFCAHATVLEYNANGDVTISETKAEVSHPPVAQRRALRDLTRDVALRYSGSSGVRKAGLDALTFVEVFEALIDAESDFDPNAVSPKGAKGLGQLMPDTVADLRVENPLDPLQNLTASAQYFSSLLFRFESLELALAAYNAGPERVKKYNGIPPFEETRAYVAEVMKTAGLSEVTPSQRFVRPVSSPINKEHPLQGETSVWEF
ncbi:lytic transglycosylase domain-containing protein [bacterium]|nr:lytic transglycosylase domain-containing protein [bacterium]